jgi:hypothetical protein
MVQTNKKYSFELALSLAKEIKKHQKSIGFNISKKIKKAYVHDFFYCDEYYIWYYGSSKNEKYKSHMKTFFKARYTLKKNEKRKVFFVTKQTYHHVIELSKGVLN